MAAPTPSRARTRRALALLAGAALLLGACSSSGGTDTFSTTKAVSSMPYFSRVATLIGSSRASPSSP